MTQWRNMDKMKEEIRLILAVVLSIVVIVIFGRLRTPQQQIPQEKVSPQQSPASISSEKSPVEKDILPPYSAEKAGEEKIYEDSRYIIKYHTSGGMIENIGIKKYTRENERALNIFDGSGLLLTYSLEEKPVDTQDIYSSIEKEGGLYFKHTTENIITEKIVKIPSQLHTFTASIDITNRGKEDIHLKNYVVSTGTIKIEQVHRGREFVPSEIIVKSNGKIFKINISRIRKSTFYENTEWIALKQRYGMVFAKPAVPQKSFITFSQDNSIITGFFYDDIEIPAGEKKSVEFSIYAGPSDYFIARDEIKDKEVFGTGFFTSLGRLLFTILSYIHRVIPNWGWAIIILTLIIKAVFFPLTLKSLRSMKALQKLRPYLQDIQKKYKNNPQQMQKELMNLYREYKINPFGGCLPMFIQFPIFIGFFIALRNSVFLRGAPFIFWIKDLSLPDTIVRIGGFPLNLLPLIMAATSFWQQKLTPQEPSQKALTFMMPVMFLVLFYNFSSGLLLYWTTMNIAGLIEQYYVHKK